MALILKRIYDVYDYYLVQYEGSSIWIQWSLLATVRALSKWKIVKIFTFPDGRVSDLFLVGSFWPITAIIFVYLYFVTGKGQELMRNRRPFELKNIIIIYNLFQIFLNLYTALGVSGFDIFHSTTNLRYAVDMIFFSVASRRFTSRIIKDRYCASHRRGTIFRHTKWTFCTSVMFIIWRKLLTSWTRYGC